MIIDTLVLNKEHRNSIKPIHAKIKGVVRAFDKANDALELVKLITAPFKFEDEYTAPKEQLEYAQKTAAVQLGLCHPFVCRAFFVVKRQQNVMCSTNNVLRW